jgi:hypothetical protein
MRIAVTTLARGRRLHLERQARAVARLRPVPDAYVVLALDEEPPQTLGADVVHRPVAPGEQLHLGAARNAMIAAARRDADLVVCVDVDCLPAPNLLRILGAAARETGGEDLLAGPVGRLGPMPARRLAPTPSERRVARDRAARGPRPLAPAGKLLRETRHELFWSLSFAVAPATHDRIGGFDEDYAGYGGEDTDYALRAHEAGVGMTWVGGAWAYHQHHPISSPPVEHLLDIVANARRFHERWRHWPMPGWLEAFAAAGLVHWTPGGSAIEVTEAGWSTAGRNGDPTAVGAWST